MFGPWAIIISSLIVDLGKFMTVLCLFLVGFSMLITAMNTPFYELLPEGEEEEDEFANCPPTTLTTTEIKAPGARKGGASVAAVGEIQFGWKMPLYIFIKLFFALFGLSNDKELSLTPKNPKALSYLFQLVFGIYMLITTIVLINLLIAMMSDTYQRIQQQSDMEWKFGRSKLITSMSKTNMAPAPINLFTSWISYLVKIRNKGKRSKVDDSSKHSNGTLGKRGNGSAFYKKIGKGENSLSVPDTLSANMGSRASCRDITLMENILDWPSVIKKYYAVVKTPNKPN